jgi:DNA-binding CsgD family transcriptional regulator
VHRASARGAGLLIRNAESGEISMIGHHTKHAVRPPSQIFPSEPAKVASDATLDETHVLLCDWHGVVVWKSGTGDRIQIGDRLWKYASKKSCDALKAAVAGVATLQEQSTLEVENERGENIRLRMWPLLEPDIAICILALRIPTELASLTERERACLRCLAQGKSTRDIAKELDIGLTTVHTHLRRSREKLGLTTAEALIGFAARYFYVPESADPKKPAPARKRSG